MGHSDTVQIKKETDGYVDWWKERESMCLCGGIYLFLFSLHALMCLPKPRLCVCVSSDKLFVCLIDIWAKVK